MLPQRFLGHSPYDASVPRELADCILEDCRRAVGEVRFGFGSKRQVWAFEERHELDVAALAAQLASHQPLAFLNLAIAFHDEFAAVGNAWRIRDSIQALTAELCRAGSAELLDGASEALIDERLAVRHWLAAALLNGPPLAAFRSLERALCRAYQPADQWSVLVRLRSLAQEHGWKFGTEATAALSELARLSADPEQRRQALDVVARFSGQAGSACLAKAARADADASVRAYAAQLLGAS